MRRDTLARDIVVPAEFCSTLAVTVVPFAVHKVLVLAVVFSTNCGWVIKVVGGTKEPLTTVATSLQVPEACGSVLQPHQLLVASTVAPPPFPR